MEKREKVGRIFMIMKNWIPILHYSELLFYKYYN